MSLNACYLLGGSKGKMRASECQEEPYSKVQQPCSAAIDHPSISCWGSRPQCTNMSCDCSRSVSKPDAYLLKHLRGVDSRTECHWFNFGPGRISAQNLPLSNITVPEILINAKYSPTAKYHQCRYSGQVSDLGDISSSYFSKVCFFFCSSRCYCRQKLFIWLCGMRKIRKKRHSYTRQ